jgi:hypothetical protein
MTENPAGEPSAQEPRGGDSVNGDQPTAEPGGIAPAPEPEPAGPSTDDIGDEQIRQEASVVNHVAAVHAGSVTFGVSAPQDIRRSPGILDRSQVSAELSHYVAPDHFDEGLRVLRQRRMVVLTGPEGIGKRAGALKLLTKVTSSHAKILSLSPVLSLLELSNVYRFSKGGGHLVLDWAGDRGTSSERRFDADRLLDRLSEAEAFLVITAQQPGKADNLESLCRPWGPPDPVALFDKRLERCAGPLPTDDEIARVRTAVKQLAACGEIVGLADRMPAGADRALDGMETTQVVKVTAWFDRQPRLYRVLSVAGLAFLDGLTERRFEVLLRGLIGLAESAPEWEERKRRPWATIDDTELPQRRADWESEDSLVKRVDDAWDDDAGSGGERRLTFRSRSIHEQVVKQLAERYGAELWGPLRSWIQELAAEKSAEIRTRLALGVTIWAKSAPAEVEEEFLIPWSGGLVAERFTAAHVLSLMSLDDAAAPHALRIARAWTQGAGARRSETAALALGGTLGVRYPRDAVGWLWFLSSRRDPVGRVARTSLALLVQSCAEYGDAITALRRLRREAKREFADGQGSLKKRSAMTALVRVLAVTRLGSSEPVAACLLRTNADSASHLGALWGHAVCSIPHRADAIDALGRTLQALDGDEHARAAVTRLGEAVRAGLSHDQRVALRRDLELALITRVGAEHAARSRELVSVLLEVLAGRVTSPPRPH